jgi:hypothetical protein
VPELNKQLKQNDGLSELHVSQGEKHSKLIFKLLLSLSFKFPFSSVVLILNEDVFKFVEFKEFFRFFILNFMLFSLLMSSNLKASFIS